MKTKFKIFAQLTKVDEVKREVSGIATCEMVDKSGEIFDYESSVPFFKAWSAEMAKATDGKSLGNVREMHTDSAVGKLTAIEFNDAEKCIPITAKVIDDAAWKKCLEGVYTGFSIGGKYVKRWQDGEFVRFTAEPFEVSVVDNPCVPDAHFTAVKADGSTEVRKFAEKAAATVAQPDVKRASVAKSLYDVGDLASLLSWASGMQLNLAWEAEMEADDSPIPGKLKDWIEAGLGILAELTAEESSELSDYLASAKAAKGEAQAAKAAGVAPNAASADVTKGETENMNIEEMKKSFASADDFSGLKKLADEQGAEIKKLAESNETLTKAVEALTDCIEKMLGEPEPAKVKANEHVVVSKTDDGESKTVKVEELKGKELMKAIHAGQVGQPRTLRAGESLV